MLHDFFSGSILSCARIWSFLTRIDAVEAERVRAEGCPRCGSCLDSAPYPRKPHGLAASLREGVQRFSFCCRDCRRRATPPSVRFFGRRFRVAPVFLAASFLVRFISRAALVAYQTILEERSLDRIREAEGLDGTNTTLRSEEEIEAEAVRLCAK